MQHNQHNPAFRFVRDPVAFNKNTERELLQYCLGATLYMPATIDIVDKIIDKKTPHLTSMVMCFEDAIQESDLPNAEKNVIRHLDVISSLLEKGSITHDDIPLTFLRPRTPQQFHSFLQKLQPRHADVLSGFVFPKFQMDNAREYFSHLANLNREFDVQLYGMPILEGRSLAHKETRVRELHAIQEILEEYRCIVLGIRVGATDFSSMFGLRRGIDYSIYDIVTVRDCLSDILNFFTREGEGYVVSAPVWEYFLADRKQDLGNLLRVGNVRHSLFQRNTIVNEAVDGLLRELILDIANGFVGKTVIHPSHIKYVNSMQAVTSEEYEDASQIVQSAGGVFRGGNKMNESNPHRNWAKRIMVRGDVYGVVKDQSSYLELFSG